MIAFVGAARTPVGHNPRIDPLAAVYATPSQRGRRLSNFGRQIIKEARHQESMTASTGPLLNRLHRRSKLFGGSYITSMQQEDLNRSIRCAGPSIGWRNREGLAPSQGGRSDHLMPTAYRTGSVVWPSHGSQDTRRLMITLLRNGLVEKQFLPETVSLSMPLFARRNGLHKFRRIE